jgi:hypothetical protein
VVLQTRHVDAWAMAALNPNRQKFLARLGRTYTGPALRRMGPKRRHPILLSRLKQPLLDLTDERSDIFAVWPRGLRTPERPLRSQHWSTSYWPGAITAQPNSICRSRSLAFTGTSWIWCGSFSIHYST